MASKAKTIHTHLFTIDDKTLIVSFDDKRTFNSFDRLKHQLYKIRTCLKTGQYMKRMGMLQSSHQKIQNVKLFH